MSRTTYRWAMIGFKLMGVVFLCMFSCCIGLLIGEESRHLAQSKERHDAVQPILAKDAAFAKLEVIQSDGGSVLILGEVKSEDDLARLKKLVVEAIGTYWANHAIGPVQVEKQSAVR